MQFVWDAEKNKYRHTIYTTSQGLTVIPQAVPALPWHRCDHKAGGLMKHM
jgi:hypothetical protein